MVTTPIVTIIWLITCWPLLVLSGLPLGAFERKRLVLIDRQPIKTLHEPSSRNGVISWINQRIHERATWNELLYGMALIPLSIVDFCILVVTVLFPVMLTTSSGLLVAFGILGIDPSVADPNAERFHHNIVTQSFLCVLGLCLLIIGLYLLTLFSKGQHHLTRLLIDSPAPQTVNQVNKLIQSRARISDSFDAERRRIERDLHDGVQQRLTVLVMILGMMRYRNDRGHDLADLIDKADTDAHEAINELRQIVHGIFPNTLLDDDLTGALEDLATTTGSSGINVETNIHLPGHIPPDIQVGIFFATSELFTNVLKHARATLVTVTACKDPRNNINIIVEDNGRGGIDTRGSGILGVRDRIETLGGNMYIKSPQGGPTRVILEVPCAL